MAQVQAQAREVPGQGIVYRQEGVVSGESNHIRERARELGCPTSTWWRLHGATGIWG